MSTPHSKSSPYLPNGTPTKGLSNGADSPLANGASTPALLSDPDGVDSESGHWTPITKANTGAGKSGRVIERLMGEVDRLTRELKLANAKCEEEQRGSESARAAMNSLKARNENLQAIADSTRAACDRKDRRLESLRGQLDGERAARQQAQVDRDVATRRADDGEKQHQQQIREHRETAMLAETQYEAFRDSVARMDARYRSQIEKLKKGLEEMQQQRTDDQQRFANLDKTCALLREDIARAQELNQQLETRYEAFTAGARSEAADIRRIAAEREQLIEKSRKEMEETVGGMRWVMNLRTDMRKT